MGGLNKNRKKFKNFISVQIVQFQYWKPRQDFTQYQLTAIISNVNLFNTKYPSFVLKYNLLPNNLDLTYSIPFHLQIRIINIALHLQHSRFSGNNQWEIINRINNLSLHFEYCLLCVQWFSNLYIVFLLCSLLS